MALENRLMCPEGDENECSVHRRIYDLTGKPPHWFTARRTILRKHVILMNTKSMKGYNKGNYIKNKIITAEVTGVTQCVTLVG